MRIFNGRVEKDSPYRIIKAYILRVEGMTEEEAAEEAGLEIDPHTVTTAQADLRREGHYIPYPDRQQKLFAVAQALDDAGVPEWQQRPKRT